MKNILFIGGTGYIGGPILSRFIERNDPDVSITALVRSPEKAKKLESLNVRVNVVMGTHNDAPLVERLATDADVVFSLADCDDLQAAESILRGHKKRFMATGVKPVLIHMSGTGCLGDNAQGMFASDTVYSDLDIPTIEALPATQSHRHVDLPVVAADAEGYVDSYIVIPGVVYGTPRGILADAGIQNAVNFAWAGLIRIAFKRGAAGIVGEGRNLLAHVDVTEVADLVALLYDAVQDGRAAHGREGYYFADNGAVEFARIVEVIEARAGTRRVLTQAELDEYFPGAVSFHRFLGDNGRSDSARGRALGWAPVKGTQDLLVALRSEVDSWEV